MKWQRSLPSLQVPEERQQQQPLTKTFAYRGALKGQQTKGRVRTEGGTLRAQVLRGESTLRLGVLMGGLAAGALQRQTWATFSKVGFIWFFCLFVFLKCVQVVKHVRVKRQLLGAGSFLPLHGIRLGGKHLYLLTHLSCAQRRGSPVFLYVLRRSTAGGLMASGIHRSQVLQTHQELTTNRSCARFLQHGFDFSNPSGCSVTIRGVPAPPQAEPPTAVWLVLMYTRISRLKSAPKALQSVPRDV